ncbi:MAG: 50S ribosomal protein L11 methyltransferase [Firmicutes bacterium]|nr:50S ribosomal protein L11 methyltransferase [Bacillota bacterium]
MDWLEISVPADGSIDALCEALEALGVGGMVVEDEGDFRRFLAENQKYWDFVDEALEARFTGVSRVKFYLPDDGAGRASLETVRAALTVPVAVKAVADSDWENNWRAYYEPIEIGERLRIVPAWLEAGDSNRLPLYLDPGLSFGTGQHASTRMCLKLLELHLKPGARVLDIGCGSGVLGIGAILLGAAFAAGCDIDPLAPEAAARNAALNGLGPDKFAVCQGDILEDAALRKNLGGGQTAGCPYDLVLANIVADVIIPLAPLIREFLRPDGIFICSGVIEGRQSDVERALTSAGLDVVSHLQEEGWHSFAAVLQGAMPTSRRRR